MSKFGEFLRKHWYILVVIGVSLVLIIGLTVYFTKCRRKAKFKEESKVSSSTFNLTDVQSTKRDIGGGQTDNQFLTEKKTVKRNQMGN